MAVITINGCYNHSIPYLSLILRQIYRIYNESDKNAQEIKKNPPLTEAKDGNTKKMRKCLLLD